MNEYRLTFSITFNALDDPAARTRAEEITTEIGSIAENADVKLQQVYVDRPPRKVNLE